MKQYEKFIPSKYKLIHSQVEKKVFDSVTVKINNMTCFIKQLTVMLQSSVAHKFYINYLTWGCRSLLFHPRDSDPNKYGV